ncbi:hypothetical protein GCM10010116_24740 [Microbispora rosea subsp. aerata]|nr:DUF4129 domain-containing protein [Microbispora rosea]GGO12327.1 hypothetical protein GCM10010116_24740 [Microbispora rosea subsp. aerata]GIH58633.1 hypothetical protein Mro02_55470 [Microbispora rosea subsp. aerata]GLJ84685.1 hypothetical protein GCM10017588_34130 [Microbispora rosea subsp. aerata]
MTVIRTAALLASPVDVGREQAAREAARELSRAGYQHEPLFDRLRREVSQFLGDLLSGGGAGGGGPASLVVITIVLAVLAVLLLWALRRLSGGRRTESGAVFGERERTAAEHRAEAERLAAEGAWAGAIQERLRAIARELEERAVVSPLPGRTAVELAEAAGQALPPHAADLRAAARLFDDVTYGGAGGTREGYRTLAALDERLRSARAGVAA